MMFQLRGLRDFISVSIPDIQSVLQEGESIPITEMLETPDHNLQPVKHTSSITELTEERLQEINIRLFNLPGPTLNNYFVGRKETLESLKKDLSKSESISLLPLLQQILRDPLTDIESAHWIKAALRLKGHPDNYNWDAIHFIAARVSKLPKNAGEISLVNICLDAELVCINRRDP
jgi:hypothetical protein